MDTDSRIRRFMPVQRFAAPLQARAVALAELVECQAGQLVYNHGDGGETVHYLLAGSVDFIWDNKITRTLSASNKAAVRALDPPGRKRYALRARDTATIARFERAALDSLAEQAEATRDSNEFEVREIAMARSSDWMVRMLQSELFNVLPATNIQKIFARMELVEYQADEVVVSQGGTGEYYYVIESGYCEVTRAIASGRGQIHLADLGPGNAFGEEALIADRARNASITMISDGRLMRLPKADFVELILNEVLQPVSLDDALSDIEAGGVWLDIRYPEDHARVALRDSENIPVNMLRLQSNRLRRDFRYIVCGDEVEQCAIAAFLLGERGFDVGYLTVTIDTAATAQPALCATRMVAPDGALPATVVYLPGSDTSTDTQRESNVMADIPPTREPIDTPPVTDDGPLGDTIARISGLYTHAEAQQEMNNKVPADRYAQTATGRALADIIDELGEQHNDIGDTPHLADPPFIEVTVPAMDATVKTKLDDAFGDIMREMEARLREEVGAAVQQRTDELEADYRAKLVRMRDLTKQEIAQREAALRRRLSEEYSEKEQLLRSYYKKVIALANNISRQKAQLQDAKRQFEEKLTSANKLYREIEGMRDLLSDQIGYLDAQEIEEIPQLSISLNR